MNKNNFLLLSMAIFLALAISVSADINTVNSLSNNLQTMNMPQIDGVKQESKFITNLFTGSAGYSYPLKVVPGINGLQPNIALSYNHLSTMMAPGVVGSAWTITQIYVYRDIQYSVSDTSNDKFWLYFNGANEELIFDAANNRYHTKHEAYLFIQKKTMLPVESVVNTISIPKPVREVISTQKRAANETKSITTKAMVPAYSERRTR